jgi:ubiquinone/menaquinone biosynthesis C-methylase UbiE
MMRGFERGLGIDYSLVDLILGSKFLQERGVTKLQLVCADARHLPLRDESVDFANATDVIEHVLPGQEQFLSEVKRVVKSRGGFYFNSPNRYNLFTPEPHVKVRGLGFLPRKWMDPYVRLLRGMNYKNYYLLSLKELRTLVSDTFGTDYILSGPFTDLNTNDGSSTKTILKKYPFLLYVLNSIFFPFLTNYHVIVFKN